MLVAIRITKSYNECKDVLLELFKGLSVVVEHNERLDNIHVHLLVEWAKSEDTLRNQLKKHFSKQYSLKTKYGKSSQLVDMDFISYMSKGKHEPSYLNGISIEQYNEYKSRGYDKNVNTIETTFTVKESVSKKVTLWKLVELFECQRLEDRIDVNQRRQLISCFNKVATRENHQMSTYKMVDLYDSWQQRFNSIEYESTVMYLIAKRRGENF